MEAYIKYIGDGGDKDFIATSKHNYVRYGKVIPHQEIKVDLCKFFSCSKDRAAFIANQLMSDRRVKCSLLKDTSSAVRDMKDDTAKKTLNKDKIKDEIADRFDKINRDARKR